GFHAASMANISEAANMSTGLIYRYFKNKHAIIVAIIERQLDEKRGEISKLQKRSDFYSRLQEMVTSWQTGGRNVTNPVLLLEMSAEGTRVPEVADAIRLGDDTCRFDFCAWLRKLAQEQGLELSEEDIRVRAFTFQCFIEGLALRTVREPGCDMEFIMKSLNTILPHLLPMVKE